MVDVDRIEYYSSLVRVLESGDYSEAAGVVAARAAIAELKQEGSDVVREADRDLIRAADILRGVGDPNADLSGEGGWWHNLWLIIEGGYPLEKLPEHLRGLARELYYD